MTNNNKIISRRTFVKGVAVASALATGLSNLEAKNIKPTIQKDTDLYGTEFSLVISQTVVNFTGTPTVATTVNGQIPAPTLHFKEGETVTIHVYNDLDVDSSIHWHGLILPTDMDGVPKISFDGIRPKESFTYTFTIKQSGTYWYHSHSGFQEQTGVYGAIVIKPKVKDPYDYDRDYVVTLSDWSDEKPESIYRKLKLMGDYYNFKQRTVGDFISEVKEEGILSAFNSRKMWGKMRMSDRDLSDVTGYTYTYLMNGETPNSHYKAIFKPNEKIRLRFINASAMTFFDVRIPNLKMTVVATDGNNINPVTVDEFRMGVAETYDVIVEPKDTKAYAIFAQSFDRSGYAVGSLTSNNTIAPTPPMDALPILSHVDMGMNMSNMAGMDMKKDSKMPMKKKIPITPLPEARGVQTTMRVEDPQYRLNDEGAGLRNNGRKVLTYADLKSLDGVVDYREPKREIILRLTGNMERYMWSINGIKYADSKPLQFHYGERLRITYINDTMMNHPMHLHGMWSDLETGKNSLVRKHTIVVQPASKISMQVTVDAKGEWAYHCHLLYHMTGMFRKVVVS
jgi:CopA family copper-resistance protein